MFKFSIIFALVLSACATAAPTKSQGIQWPQGSPARVRLDYVLTGPEDLGIRRPWYVRWWNVIAGDAEENRFQSPFSVAIFRDKLAIGDTLAGVVWYIDRANGEFERFDRIQGEAIQAPVGLAMDETGIWVSDSEKGMVEKIDFDGERLAVLDQLSRPAGLALSPDGRLAIAEPAAHRVTVVLPGGERRQLGANGREAGQFNFPTQVSFGPGGALFVTDALNFRIQQFDRQFNFVGAFGERGDAAGFFARPRGIAVDDNNAVYVADALFDCVQVFDTRGQLLLVVGTGGQGPGELWMPAGLAYSNGELLVADTQNGRVMLMHLENGATP